MYICHYFPGFFKNKENTERYTRSGKVAFADGIISLLPDYEKIPEEVVDIIEYLTTKLDDNKVKSLYFISTSVINELHKNYIIHVITNYDEKESQKVFNFGAMSIVVNFIFYDKKTIYKILNTLNKKDYAKEEMNEVEFMQFIQAISFVKSPYAKDFIEESVKLFITIEKIDEELQMDLFLTLKVMIKYYFKYDKKKLWRLLIMILKAIPTPTPKKVVKLGYPYDELENRRLIIKKQYNDLNKKDKELTKRNKELRKKDKEIVELKKRIEKLENQ